MTRVATFGNYQSALSDLMAAQTRAQQAQERVSTQKVATDMVGFGRTSETLTAFKGAQSRIQGFIDAADAASARLDTQDLALNQVNDAIGVLRTAIGGALATESGVSLMLDTDAAFQAVKGGLNTRHHGSYLFAGANTDQMPMTAQSLSDLTAAPTVASLFTNDNLKSVSRVAEGTSLETGVLASELGTDTLEILRDIQAFHTGPQGPLSGKLTTEQKDFLTAQLTRLGSASGEVVNQAARTGAMANQVDSVVKSNKAQLASLGEIVSGKTDANMAEAITDLQLAQVAIQASAQVVVGLRDISLLNYLR